MGGTFGSGTAKAGVVEGEEDEDEDDASSNVSETGPTSTTDAEPAVSGVKASPTKSGPTTPATTRAVPVRKYNKNERKVVDMNQALRKAPVKKLRDTFVEIRTELAPTQTSLTASIRAANEAIGQCVAIDERLAQLGERIYAIKPLFPVN